MIYNKKGGFIIKNYRLDDSYLEKLSYIKNSIKTRTEYSKVKVNDTDVIKIIIDSYHEYCLNNVISDEYIYELASRINQNVNVRVSGYEKLFDVALGHFEKNSKINNILIDNLLRWSEMNPDNIITSVTNLPFAIIAQKVVDEIDS